MSFAFPSTATTPAGCWSKPCVVTLTAGAATPSPCCTDIRTETSGDEDDEEEEEEEEEEDDDDDDEEEEDGEEEGEE